MTADSRADAHYGLDDDTLSRAILNSIQTRIAVVDTAGQIVVVNDAWNRFARENGDPDLLYTGVGINYLDVTERSAANGDTLAAKAMVGMRRVLEDVNSVFEQRYPCHSPTEERWYLMRVTPLRGSDQRGLVISHIDITMQHLAARSRARRQHRARTSRRQAREFAAMQSTDNRMASTEKEPYSDALDHQYQVLLEQAFERRVFKGGDEAPHGARALANALGRQTAGPRDVIAIHTRVMDLVRQKKYSSARTQVYLEEGRILLIEIMGYLAAYYRDMIMADFEQRGL